MGIHCSSNKLRQLRHSWSALARRTTIRGPFTDGVALPWPFHENWELVCWSTISVGTFITCLFGTPSSSGSLHRAAAAAEVKGLQGFRFYLPTPIWGIGVWDPAEHVNWKLKPEWMAKYQPETNGEEDTLSNKGQMVTAMTNGVGFITAGFTYEGATGYNSS